MMKFSQADCYDTPERQLRVFLGGPIQHLNTHDNSATVVAWHREIVQALLAARCEVYSAHEVEAYGDDSAWFTPAEVTSRDFKWATDCDVYIAVLPTDGVGYPYRSDGTHIEIGWVTALRKRVILMLDDHATQPYSHLVLGLIANGNAELVSLTNWRAELIDCLVGTSDPVITA